MYDVFDFIMPIISISILCYIKHLFAFHTDFSRIFQPKISCAIFSSPAFSRPFVPHFPVSHFPALQFCAVFSIPAFSIPAFFLVPHFHVSHFQSPLLFMSVSVLLTDVGIDQWRRQDLARGGHRTTGK